MLGATRYKRSRTGEADAVLPRGMESSAGGPCWRQGFVRAVRMHRAVHDGLVAVASRVEFAGPMVTLLVTAAGCSWTLLCSPLAGASCAYSTGTAYPQGYRFDGCLPALALGTPSCRPSKGRLRALVVQRLRGGSDLYYP